MEFKIDSAFKDFINNIENYLENRKNLMVYDDYIDEKDNEAYRFFYSNPRRLLEFISLDIYKSQYKNSPLGVISTITSKEIAEDKVIITRFGKMILSHIIVRDIPKTKVELVVKTNEYKIIKEIIEYFEEYLA